MSMILGYHTVGAEHQCLRLTWSEMDVQVNQSHPIGITKFVDMRHKIKRYAIILRHIDDRNKP